MSEMDVIEKQPVTLRVNGNVHELEIAPARTLLDVLRSELRLTGAKRSCNQGVCGACSVLRDGKPVRACISLAFAAEDSEITTIEGLADGNRLSRVQQAFVDAGAVQCGFCMPAMVIAATALLNENPNPGVEEIRHGLGGNICRCSGYVKVVDAILSLTEGSKS